MVRNSPQHHLARGAATLVLVLAGACGSSSSPPNDGSSVARDTNASIQPDSRLLQPDSQRASDAKTYPTNSRKCSLSFGNASHCECSDGTPAATDPSACSTSSVAPNPGQQGACCEDSFSCACIGYVCVKSDSDGTCVCNNVGSGQLPTTGTTVTECPAPANNHKCCFSRNTHDCVCSSSGCITTGSVEVPTCSLSMVAVCNSDQKTLSNCK
jgi:hypothetical protein